MASGGLQVPILKGHSNYVVWKTQIKMYLIHQGLFECVTGDCEDENKKQKALAILVLALDPSLLYIIGPDPDSAADVWTLLQNQFQKDSWLNKLTIKKKLYNLRLTGNNVSGHIKEMTELFQSLTLLGCEVEDEEKVCLLLSSLPKQYDILVTALGASEKAPSFEQVTEKLLAGENRSSLTNTGEEALKAKGKLRGPMKCFYCHKEGHFKSACPLLKKKDRNSDKKNVKSFMVKEKCLSGSTSKADRNMWILDSGATSHMCNDETLFSDFVANDNVIITLGDGSEIKSTGVGKVMLNCNKEHCMLNDVICVPGLAHNLISVGKIIKYGGAVSFSESEGRIFYDGEYFADAKYDFNEKQFVLNCKPCMTMTNYDSIFAAADHDVSTVGKEDLWHCRFGHLGADNLSKLSKKEMVTNFDFNKQNFKFCEFCTLGKHNRSPFPHSESPRASDANELIHSDVCGPLPDSLGSNKYFVTFIDDSTRHCWAYSIKSKDKVFDVFREFRAMVEKTTGKPIKTLRSDNGGEYKSNAFKEYMTECGIRHEFTVPYTPEQNGAAERLNRVLMEKVRAMLIQSKLPHRFWAEALNTAVHVHNLSPSWLLGDKTPREMFTGKKPNVAYLRSFGCTAYAHVPKEQRKKLDPKSKKCIFMGYGQSTKGYRLYDIEKKGIILSRDVVFVEQKFEGLDKIADPAENTELCPYLDLNTNDEKSQNQEPDEESQNQEHLIQPKKSSRLKKPVERLGEWLYSANSTNVCEVADPDPKNLSEALQRQDSKFWIEATESEYNSLIENKVWELTKLPDGRKPVGCKWVFKKKINPDGSIQKYKARLVAQGFSQVYGEDYDEVFAPVARFESVRAIVSQAVKKGMHIHQMDVTAAFLNGDLQEEIYMKQPEGFEGEKDLVCRLKRSLYGLKQSPKCWNEKFDSCLLKMNFQKTIDPCVYVRKNSKGEEFILCLYVDDLILATADKKELDQVKSQVADMFEVKDLGEVHYFLGVEFKRQTDGSMWLGQQAYIKQTLAKYGMENCSPTDTPVCTSQKLTHGNQDSERVDPQMYKSAVGSLLHLCNRTRPDIAYAVGLVSRFSSDPCKEHWMAVKRIFRYLKSTTNYGLLYKAEGSTDCVGFSDADWAGDLSDRKSTSGFVFLSAEGAILWGSKKQSCVALSTAEAEYVALSLATQESTWLSNLMFQIGASDQGYTIIYEDNQSAICLANGQGSKRSKHIDIKYHFIQDKISNGEIIIQYCDTNEMIADIFTKPLAKDKFNKLRALMGMRQYV